MSSPNIFSSSCKCVHLKPCLQYMAEPPPPFFVSSILSCLNGSANNVSSISWLEWLLSSWNTKRPNFAMEVGIFHHSQCAGIEFTLRCAMVNAECAGIGNWCKCGWVLKYRYWVCYPHSTFCVNDNFSLIIIVKILIDKGVSQCNYTRRPTQK